MTVKIFIDLGSITPVEAKAISALMATIVGSESVVDVEHTPVAGDCNTITSQIEEADAVETAAPVRRRRTKAEIEADKAEPKATVSMTKFNDLLMAFTDAAYKSGMDNAKRMDEHARWKALGPACHDELLVVVNGLLTQKAPEAVSAPAAAEGSAPTFEQLRAAVKLYTEKKGIDAATELLADFGCDRSSQLPKLPVEEQVNFLKLASNA